MKQILADMQADPRAAAEYVLQLIRWLLAASYTICSHLRNPEVAKRILKLKAAGIIR